MCFNPNNENRDTENINDLHYEGISHYREAIEPLNRAIELIHNNIMNNHTIHLLNENERNSLLDEIREEYPFLHDMFYSLGHSYYNIGDYGRSIYNLLTASKLNPEDENIFHFLALSYQRIGDYNMALCHFQRALELSPNNSNISRDYDIALAHSRNFIFIMNSNI